MKIQTNSNQLSVSAYKLPNTFKSRVHIVDGFAHADTMEHFAKAALKNVSSVGDVQMHYVECNRYDINTKQMNSVEDMLKSLSSRLGRGDFVVIPGLASAPVLNLQDRVRAVLSRNINLTAQNLKSYKGLLMEFLREIYKYKSYYSSEISYLDKNSQKMEYTYGVINEINKMVKNGVKVYVPAGHGADSTIKWMAKDEGLGDEMHKFIATGRDTYSQISGIFDRANRNNYYDFNLLSLSDANIVNIRGKNGRNYLFSAKDGFVNDSEDGVYNFTPVRSSGGKLLGYSFHDETGVEYPYDEFNGNERIANLCKYVGLPRRDFYSSGSEDKQFRKNVRNGYSTSYLPDRLYNIREVFDESEIRRRKLDTLGTLINREQNLIFDTTSKGKIIFQKTNCEGSEKPSVLQMWGSCFSAINAMVRDVKKAGGQSLGSSFSASSGNPSYYITQAERAKSCRDYTTAEYYYNEALNILHPNKASLKCDSKAIETYESLYSLLKSNHKYSAAKGTANMIINLKAYSVKDLSIFDSHYKNVQSEMGDYYEDMADFCRRESEYYASKVCKWAAAELRKSSTAGDKILRKRSNGNQYVGDLYNEYN